MNEKQQCTKDHRLAKAFVLSAGLILGVTGLAKIWSAFGDAKLLGHPDPIFQVEFRYLMLAVGCLELGMAYLCFCTKRTYFTVILVAWISTMFLGYRLGVTWMQWKTPCICLGSLTDSLHVTPQMADNITQMILAVLLGGSYGLLVRHWWRRSAAHRSTS